MAGEPGFGNKRSWIGTTPVGNDGAYSSASALQKEKCKISKFEDAKQSICDLAKSESRFLEENKIPIKQLYFTNFRNSTRRDILNDLNAADLDAANKKINNIEVKQTFIRIFNSINIASKIKLFELIKSDVENGGTSVDYNSFIDFDHADELFSIYSSLDLSEKQSISKKMDESINENDNILKHFADLDGVYVIYNN